MDLPLHRLGLRMQAGATTVFLMCLCSNAQSENNWQTSVVVDSFNYSAPVTIGDNFKDWEGATLERGNAIYTKNRFDAGFGKEWYAGTTSAGYTSQYHYYLDFSDDTARYHHNDKNSTETAIKDILDVYIEANHLSGYGLFIAHSLAIKGVKLSAHLTYLKTRDLMLGVAQGQYDPAPLDSLTNETQITIDYAYREERILDRQVEGTEGKGWLADIALEWHHKSHTIIIDADNAWTRLEWPDAPGSLITGNLADITRNSNAAIEFKEFYGDITQTLPSHIRGRYRYHTTFKSRSLGGGIDYEKLGSAEWEKLVFSIHTTNTSQMEFSYTPRIDAWGVRWANRYAEFYWEADNLDAFDAHLFNIGIMGIYRW